ncbi:MAG TPA: LytTR family transcriptional regulator DNA-binding domain-containing protein [Puia sp.]|nr:LytTR family transcriptional regulator DNA-binding domain-containing protein [Puia sp.]
MRILIVEDEPIIALDLSTGLQQFGYIITGIAEDEPSAVGLFTEKETDIVLMDINLKGEKDGVFTALQLLKIRSVPVIYLTAFTDATTVQRVKQTHPAAFLSKPYTVQNVQIAIELALHNFTAGKTPHQDRPPEPAPDPQRGPGPDLQRGPAPDSLFQWNDHLFVKVNYRFIKIALAAVLYLAAENNYIHLVTSEKKYLLRLSLQQFMDKIACDKLVRIHRSYIVHLDAIQSFTEQEVTIDKEVLPVGRQYRDSFLQQFGWKG